MSTDILHNYKESNFPVLVFNFTVGKGHFNIILGYIFIHIKLIISSQFYFMWLNSFGKTIPNVTLLFTWVVNDTSLLAVTIIVCWF